MPVKKPDYKKQLHAVIMAGGKGTRFWPLSREAFPKQFLRLIGERTLIQDTIHRLRGGIKPSNILVVTTKGQKDIVEWQLKELLGGVNCILEPEGKNTAPAVALAAFKLYKKSKDALMLILPSDHHIGDAGAFLSAVETAAAAARKGDIVTFGIKPSRPETGYGYIKTGKKLMAGVFSAARFIEKPDLKTAKTFLKDGSYYWNSGIFLFRVKDIIAELKRHMPELHQAFSEIARYLNTDKEEEALKEVYRKLKEESIDYGVMEKSERIAVVTADFKWSDIGSWSALDDVLDKNSEGNVLFGNVVEVGCKDSILFAGARLIAAIGLEDMVVVDTQDATLIVPKEKVQQVKELVGRLKKEGKEEYLAPKVEERPWGHFSVLEKGLQYKIKHICLKPKARLSLQMHAHRSEHWIVVSGVAKVHRGEEEFIVNKNESTFIPASTKHRLENPGLIPLKIIEIQSGEHLGEDDITRFEDSYGRC
ncbi:MAG: mannose-1-phosphate guanylyltransferase/mannose-6-phosphate isomerase [Thermodesulfovibrionales bacterium]|nr:mannose-1-phosphate guanylyltransferase/mannose-6-phosphate isomerase [Thermodesulfovibrionales bacterium]